MESSKAKGKSSEPDGGWRGWIAVLAAWTRAFVWVGVIKGLGVMLPTLEEQFSTKAWVIGSVSALVVAAAGLIGPFAKTISRRFPPGYVIITCGLVTGLTAIAGSFSGTVSQLALTYLVPTGMACGVAGVLVKASIACCFSKNYTTAVGVTRTGTSVGLFLFPPLTQLFLNTYGWRGTLLLTGAISLHLAVCGALLVVAERHHTKRYQQLPAAEHSDVASKTDLKSKCEEFWKSCFKNLDFGLLINFRYWALALITCLTTLTYDLWVIYFVSLAQSNRFSPEDAATFVTVAGVCSLVARVTQGFFIDRELISYWNMTGVTVIMISASLCAIPWLTSKWMMMMSSSLMLIGNGILFCLTDVLIKEVMGLDLLPGTYGWIGIKTATLAITLGFFPGWVYDTTGSYNSAFFVLGCLQGLALIPLLGLRFLRASK